MAIYIKIPVNLTFADPCMGVDFLDCIHPGLCFSCAYSEPDLLEFHAGSFPLHCPDWW